MKDKIFRSKTSKIDNKLRAKISVDYVDITNHDSPLEIQCCSLEDDCNVYCRLCSEGCPYGGTIRVNSYNDEWHHQKLMKHLGNAAEKSEFINEFLNKDIEYCRQLTIILGEEYIDKLVDEILNYVAPIEFQYLRSFDFYDKLKLKQRIENDKWKEEFKRRVSLFDDVGEYFYIKIDNLPHWNKDLFERHSYGGAWIKKNKVDKYFFNYIYNNHNVPSYKGDLLVEYRENIEKLKNQLEEKYGLLTMSELTESL